jgi:hypothetical protein
MNRVAVPARQVTEAGGIDCLESIPGLLKSLKIRTVVHVVHYNVCTVQSIT